MKAQFISQKVIHFDYLLKINGDVLNDKDIRKIESSFAQIKNSDDYSKIIDYLEKVASHNNKHINRNPL